MEKKSTSPSTGIISSYRSADLDWSRLFGELIDNAFGEDAGNATEVIISIQASRKNLRGSKIRVIDNGVGLRDLAAGFQLGYSLSRASKTDIGQYGIGAKAAGIWAAENYKIATFHEGRYYCHAQNWDQIEESGQWPDVDVDGAPAEDAKAFSVNGKRIGTMVELRGLRSGRTWLNTANLGGYLGRLYAPALRAGKKIYFVDHRPKSKQFMREVEAFELPELEDKKENHTLAVNDMPLSYKAGILSAQYPRSMSGLSVEFGHRVIMKLRKLQGITLPENIAGTITLSPDWKSCLSPHKDSITRYRELFEETLYEELKALIETAEEYQRDVRLEAISNAMTRALQNVVNKSLNGATGFGGRDSSDKPSRSGPDKPGIEQEPGPGEKTMEGDLGDETKEVSDSGIRIAFKRMETPDTPYLHDEQDGLLTIVLNISNPIVSELNDPPFDVSGTWSVIGTAFVNYLLELPFVKQAAFFPPIREYFNEELGMGQTPPSSVIMREVYREFLKQRPDYREPTKDEIARLSV